MDKRIELALVYVNSKEWIGGTYYVENLVSALNRLNDNDKPKINLYCDSINNYEHFKEVTSYPYIEYHYFSPQKPLLFKVLNAIRYFLNPLTYNAIGSINLEKSNNIFIYPVRYRTLSRPINKQLAWIPDFQEKYYPQFFTKGQLKMRENVHRGFIFNKIPIVFSSEDSKSSFYTFYPDAKDVVKTYVLHFAVTHPVFKNNIVELKKKYGIKHDYLFCANQFWMHKNHKLLFEAFAEAMKKGLSLQLVCTGNLFDYRNSDYGRELEKIIEKNQIKDDLKMVGFISREEQLCLMANSYAIVQPSLFEGWSTVVEDAKALNKFLFLSDIKVHREQKPVNVCYFDPFNKSDLANKLLSTKIQIVQYDYNSDVVDYAKSFLHILKEFSSN